jgi:hypothetical protein
VSFLLTLLLVVIGLVLLLLSLAVVAFGAYMALDERHREPGVLLAVWWIPAVAASIGILMRDLVTLTVGVLCFVVAGAALLLDLRGTRKLTKQRPASRRPHGRAPARQEEPTEQGPVGGRRTGTGGGTRKAAFYESAKRRISDKIKEYRKATS